MTLQHSRLPRRFDFGDEYPRLVRPREPGEAPDASLLRAQTDLILNAAGEGIYGLDLEGHCTFANPAAARMTGHSVEELLGRSMHDVVHHSHAEGTPYRQEDCPIYAAFKDGMIRNVCDEVFWRKDGSRFPVDYTSTPLFHGNELVGAVVVFRDITLRHQTETKLRQALREVQLLEERLQRENSTLRMQIESVRGLQEIVGHSAALRALMRLLARAAPTDSTILIHGETGTGKELVARAIHRMSRRAEQPMVRVNCSSLGSQLADSELFGHEKGAFTGAIQRRVGRFEQARGGTLFLDEVAELPLETQAKLLRVLQEREFERVGGNETVTADVRLVVATNRDLKQCVEEGRFRADLFFRLNVVPVFVPSLRDRASDIPALADHFLRQLEIRLGRSLGRVGERGLQRLTQYSWPGNVRELHNVLERAAVLSDGVEIEIPDNLLSFDEAPCRERTSEPPPPVASPAPGASHDELPSIRTLDEVERRHIATVLSHTKWRLSGPLGASAILGLHPNTLRHRMKKLGIAR